MTQKLIRDIRNDLAALGKEFTVKETEEVCQLLANLAGYFDGCITLDPGGDWGLACEIDPLNPDEAFIGIAMFDTDAEDN